MIKNKTIFVFLKAPVAGQVKTRLAMDIGDDNALHVYRQLVEAQISRLPKDWRIEIHFTPGNALTQMTSWLGNDFHYYPQCEGDLGARLQEGFKGALHRGSQLVCAIGGDCPMLAESHFSEVEGILSLSPEDIVIGPSKDGGYYLIGSCSDYPFLFNDIPWSTKSTLAETLVNIRAAQKQFHLLEELYDVDTVDDLRTSNLSRTTNKVVPQGRAQSPDKPSYVSIHRVAHK